VRGDRILARLHRHPPSDGRLVQIHQLTLLRLQRPDEAADAYRGALKLRPDLAEAHSNLGLIAGNAGDLEEAERRFRRALALDPDLLAARFNLAQLLGATGRGAEARREIEAILARDPGHQGALQLRATLDGAR